MAQETAVLEQRLPASPAGRFDADGLLHLYGGGPKPRPSTITDVRLAHVREHHAATGVVPWRLAAAVARRRPEALARPRGCSAARRGHTTELAETGRCSGVRSRRSTTTSRPASGSRPCGRSRGPSNHAGEAGRRRGGHRSRGPWLRSADPSSAVLSGLLRLRTARRHDLGAPRAARSPRRGSASRSSTSARLRDPRPR